MTSLNELKKHLKHLHFIFQLTDAEIKAAEIIKSEWTNDDGCVVTLRLYKKRLNDFLSGRLLDQK